MPGQGVGPDRGLTFHLRDTLQGLSVTHNALRRLTLPSLPKSSGFPKTSARAWQPGLGSTLWEVGGRAGCQEQCRRDTELVLRIQDSPEKARVWPG